MTEKNTRPDFAQQGTPSHLVVPAHEAPGGLWEELVAAQSGWARVSIFVMALPLQFSLDAKSLPCPMVSDSDR